MRSLWQSVSVLVPIGHLGTEPRLVIIIKAEIDSNMFNWNRSLRLFTIFIVWICYSSAEPTCPSNVYCKGPLLHTVQTARIFRDSKTFVDLKMIKSERETLDDFDNLVNATQNPSREQIDKFVKEHFIEGNELLNWTLPDFKPEPPFLHRIKDKNFKEFAKELVAIWPLLSRKVSPEVQENPERYSLIDLPNGFVIPGGRFKEIYYWDSFWIIEGLITSGMKDTARGMIENLMHMVKLFGHVPNGSRVYYMQRSQPPMLTAMVEKYLRHTLDLAWLRNNIEILEKELEFWKRERSIKVTKNGETYTLLRYFAPSEGPRPESYAEDFENSETLLTDEQREFFYTNLKSAAESGWDFSSRWFVNSNGTTAGNLSDISMWRLIPVDLNSIYAAALNSVGRFNIILGNAQKAKEWLSLAYDWRNAIDKVLWNEEDGIWYDYDTELQRPRKYFFPSNLAPAWKLCIDSRLLRKYAPKIINYLKNSGALDYPGGVPTSISRTGEQWDLPNAWPPLQSVIVNALENMNTVESKSMAKEQAQLWVRANYKGFKKHGEMFEKYDAEVPGEFGGGGEYVVQFGFGWANGVVLEFLNRYGDIITSED